VNDFGIDLTGLKAIYSKATFSKPNATRPSRTFLCEGGPGCKPTSTGMLGLPFGGRTITGRWAADGQRDTISSAELEAYIDTTGNEIERPKPTTKIDAYVAVAPGEAARESEEESPLDSADVKDNLAEAVNKKSKAKKVPKAVVKAPAVSTGEGKWDAARAVELFKQGMKISDIAIEMGYPRGQGNNRVRNALKAAGLQK
jgi:hypothetical protein